MDELGQQDGAVGWASSTDRPELVAQIATACYIAADNKAAPRRVGGDTSGTVSTIKSGDLLAVPTAHWHSITSNTQLLAEFLRDFQFVVAGGLFPYSSCPYPAVAALYVGLRWHHYFDRSAGGNKPWGRAELDALYRAFFWRNALINRYDQGFLSKLGTDLRELRTILDDRVLFDNINSWTSSAEPRLSKYLHDPSQAQLPTEDGLFDELTDGRPIGATLRTFTLPMIASIRTDLIDPDISLEYPIGEEAELHHIYPKAWCSNSKSGRLKAILDKSAAGKDWVNSIVNLMPLSRQSNNSWKIALPGQIIDQHHLKYDHLRQRLATLFIDERAFDLLRKGADGIPEFWEARGRLMANDLLGRARMAL
jgi:hypothetical protein